MPELTWEIAFVMIREACDAATWAITEVSMCEALNEKPSTKLFVQMRHKAEVYEHWLNWIRTKFPMRHSGHILQSEWDRLNERHDFHFREFVDRWWHNGENWEVIRGDST